ncbi:glycosyltransferase family 4 protein [Vibrio sp. JZG10]
MKVLIIQKTIKHYRLDFYNRLNKKLKDHGVELLVVYSELNDKNILSKKDNSRLDPSFSKLVRGYSFFKGKVVYQNALALSRNYDLIIVEQANKNIINYLLLALRSINGNKVAYWGHGKNLQSDNYGFKERFKRALLKKVNWWFAYTAMTQRFLIESGVSNSIITNVNNSIDTKGLSNNIDKLSGIAISEFKKVHGIGENDYVGLFCGSLYDKKELPFLISSVEKARQKIPNFKLIILGDGPDREYIENKSAKEDWLIYLGAAFGLEKSISFAICDLVLNPGLVGLGILDAFASGKPILTTDYRFHSPEVSYLEHGKNGLMVPKSIDSFSNAIVSLLNDEHTLTSLKEGSKLSSEKYTTEIMADNFFKGIVNFFEK